MADSVPFAQSVLASLRTGLLAVSADGAIEALSDEALRILAASGGADGWLGEPIARLLAGEPELLALVRDAQAGREHPGRAELSLRGPERTIGFTLLPVHEGGALRGAALLFRDLTPFERRG